ncbi:hypothetical protein C1646_735174 [Rhizophagus diaphanus]|nr:hypothetical protein [Glomus sp. DAOM 229456]RGB22183.1 hypothetical protein C1646_735174 [Rhizophagus diaphanus] [Rhizophagus sp. MUCL 43196]
MSPYLWYVFNFRILIFSNMTRFFPLSAFATLSRSIASFIPYTFKGIVWDPSTEPLPPAKSFYGIPMIPIYASSFLDLLFQYINTIINSSTHPKPFFNFIIEAQLQAGPVRTVGRGFLVEKETDLTELRAMLEGFIENFETQSGVPEDRKEESVVSSLIKVYDRSEAPAVDWTNPLAVPYSPLSSKDTPKKRSSPRATADKLEILNSQLSELKTTQLESTRQIVEAIKSIPTQAPAATPSLLSWTLTRFNSLKRKYSPPAFLGLNSRFK